MSLPAPTFTLTADQLYALISAAQDGVLPVRNARQERNRRYHQARKQRLVEMDADVAQPVSPVAEEAAVSAVMSDGRQTLSDGDQTFSDARKTLSDGRASETGPSPSPPPSPPSPRPPSSAPTPTPPSASASAGPCVRDEDAALPVGPATAAEGTAEAGQQLSGWLTDGLSPTAAPGPPGEDETWLRGLELDAEFHGIPVREELRRMQAWYAVRQLPTTRRQFLNWLKRYERPLQAPPPPPEPTPCAAAGSTAAESFFAGTAVEGRVRGKGNDE